MKHGGILTSHQYLNLETFRKNGVAVKTPVWFVQDGDAIFVRTLATSGKVKRIRNNRQVNIAPCKVDGKVLGDWYPAEAQEITNPDTFINVDRLLDRKYGLTKKFYWLFEKLQRSPTTVLKIDLLEQV